MANDMPHDVGYGCRVSRARRIFARPAHGLAAAGRAGLDRAGGRGGTGHIFVRPCQSDRCHRAPPLGAARSSSRTRGSDRDRRSAGEGSARSGMRRVRKPSGGRFSRRMPPKERRCGSPRRSCRPICGVPGRSRNCCPKAVWVLCDAFPPIPPRRRPGSRWLSSKQRGPGLRRGEIGRGGERFSSKANRFISRGFPPAISPKPWRPCSGRTRPVCRPAPSPG